MSSTLNIAKIKADATSLQEIPKLMDQLQKAIDVHYPGYRVTISSNTPTSQTESISNDTFSALSGIAQIETILRGKDEMELNALYEEMTSRGSKMSKPTMMSVLSSNRTVKFKRVRRGFWTLYP